MNNIICSRAPLRLGLAGGGTDVSPFSEEYGGFVLNATIDLYAYSFLEPLSGERIIFTAEDREESIEFEASPILTVADPLRLHRGVYNRIVSQFNGGKPLSFKLTTYADVPAGSGLGSSSTMVVCIIQSFSEWLNLKLSDYAIASLAFEIEREELKLAGGKQDQYAAAFGGFNFIEFGPGVDRVLVNPLRIKDSTRKELEMSIVLFYTGQSRDSEKIIKQQIENAKLKSSSSLAAMHLLKEDAFLIKEAILHNDWKCFANIMRQSWEAKKQLASSVSSPMLDKIYDDAIQAGALAGKLSGAGGGGFYMFFVPPCKRMSLIRKLKQYNGQVLNFRFTSNGAESWNYHKI